MSSAGTSDNSDLNNVINVLYIRSTDRQKYLRTNVVLQAIIEGLFDEQSILSLLNGTPEIIQTIWNDVVAWWKTCIQPGPTAYWDEFKDPVFLGLYARHMVRFPQPTGLQINMMPFVMARTFEESLLPKYLKPYWNVFFRRKFFSPLLHGHIVVNLVSEKELGKIGYLTIEESVVEAGQTQFRSGLHTECPGKLLVSPNGDGRYTCLGRPIDNQKEGINHTVNCKLGGGHTDNSIVNCHAPWGQKWAEPGTELIGGIYVATNVENYCAIHNCTLSIDANNKDVIGSVGDVEHLCDVLPEKPEVMKADKVYWLTDRTPFEFLPLNEARYFQYFRLVTSEVSLWFEEHYTKNPCGVVPDPEVTRTVTGAKCKSFRLLGERTSNTGAPSAAKAETCLLV